MENWKKKLGELSFTKGYYFKMGDNGLVEKKDDQLIFTRKELEHFIQQELDRAREEGRKNIFTEEESRVIRFAFRNMEQQINTVWDEETYNQIEKKLERYIN